MLGFVRHEWLSRIGVIPMYNFRTSLVLLIGDSLVACEMFDLDSEMVSEWVKCVYLEYLPKGPSWTMR